MILNYLPLSIYAKYRETKDPYLDAKNHPPLDVIIIALST